MNMKLCKHVKALMGVNEKLQDDGSEACSDPGMFRSLIGKLLYVTYSQPNICLPVNFLSRFMNKPNKNQFTIASEW